MPYGRSTGSSVNSTTLATSWAGVVFDSVPLRDAFHGRGVNIDLTKRIEHHP